MPELTSKFTIEIDMKSVLQKLEQGDLEAENWTNKNVRVIGQMDQEEVELGLSPKESEIDNVDMQEDVIVPQKESNKCPSEE